MQLMADSNIKSSSAFVIEILPELRARIVNGRNWKDIAMYQMKEFFSPDSKQAKEDMDRLMKLYTDEVFEEFMEDPKCAECGAAAT